MIMKIVIMKNGMKNKYEIGDFVDVKFVSIIGYGKIIDYELVQSSIFESMNYYNYCILFEEVNEDVMCLTKNGVTKKCGWFQEKHMKTHIDYETQNYEEWNE